MTSIIKTGVNHSFCGQLHCDRISLYNIHEWMKVVSSVSCPDDPTNFTAAATTVADKVQLASLSTI